MSGKVTFTEPGNPTPKSVTAGMVLSDDATVVVGKKANFTLVCDDRSLAVNKKGTHQMAMLSKDVQANGVTSRFAKMAFAAKGFVRTDSTKKKAWGDKDSILINFPLKGKILLNHVTFNWTALKAGSTYKLIVYQNSKEAPIISATTSVASFSFDPTQLAIKAGQVCHAQVMLDKDSKTTSKVVSFTFVTSNEPESILATLNKDNEYAKASPTQKLLMEAIEFESKELNATATERYQKAMKLGGNNELTNQMYAAFLERMGK
ncbi:MAG: hypothetical protein IPN76_16930 [Saprospiraceae bacterium]|nr:hypothetical protein [Saprospiraceae bacterium]